MGKPKKSSKGRVARKENTFSNRDDFSLDPSSRDYIYDEVDNFNDKDDDYSHQIINDYNAREQVLGIGGLSSDDDDDLSENTDNDEELIEDGIISHGERRVLDERMMGRKKRDYFGTDIPDEKIHNEAKQRSKNDPLNLIEDGARKLQERMAAQLKGLSYSHLLPQVEKVAVESQLKATAENIISKSSVSNKKFMKILQKESPEFLSTVSDFREKCEELKTILSPLMNAKKEELLPSSPCIEYLQTRYLLSLNYVTVVSLYLAIHSSKSYSSDHPVISRVSQFQHLYKELEACKRKYDPELMSLLEDLNSGKLKKTIKRKILNVVSKISDKKTEPSHELNESFSEYSEDDSDENNPPNQSNILSDADDKEMSSDENEDDTNKSTNTGIGLKSLSADDRRKITYTMTKNKGLMPSRKKEQRNPRVKYKNKYAKKLKRRKGQVREVRKEIERYGGEISGIKANLVKSRKLK